MKNKLLALLATLGLVVSASAVEINENLSINGFIDASYHDDDRDGTEHDLGLDEVELNFLFNNGPVSGEVHLDNTAMDHGGGTLDIEQAFMSYSVNDALTISLGRMASGLGLEKEDPGGLFTYSRAYGNEAFNLGNVDAENANGTHALEGLRLGLSNDVFSGALTLYSGNELDDEDLDIEVSLAYTGIENLVLGGGARFDNEAAAADEVEVLNIFATYTAGKALLGFEYTQLDDADNAQGEADAYTILVDYDFTEKLGGALRYSDNEAADLNGFLGGSTDNYEKFTIAPNYAITDNLGAILEYSDVDNGNVDANEIALEFTYTF